MLESEFDEMVSREGIVPAPYMDREHWVLVLDLYWLNDAEWEHYIGQSYELVKASMPPKKIQ
ncbi:MAG: MmcQ/YjbR family DNA-binding protein [Saprospiraceae bacterium]